MPYSGHEEATAERVKRYLKEHYTEEDGTVLSDARLTEVVTEHQPFLDRGVEVGRLAKYVSKDIADEARLLRHDTDSQP